MMMAAFGLTLTNLEYLTTAVKALVGVVSFFYIAWKFYAEMKRQKWRKEDHDEIMKEHEDRKNL